MIEIEFEEPKINICDCCGRDVVSLTRFIHRDGDAFAAYFAKFTRGHSDKIVFGLIGLGEWGDGTEPEDRLAFPFRIWTNDTNYQVGLVDGMESPWSHVTLFGKILDREEALQHSWIKEVFHITDHIVAEDKMVIDYFKK